MGDRIVGNALIVQKNTTVGAGMYDQEKNQKYTGDRHYQFFTNRGSEIGFPGHVTQFTDFKSGAKIQHDRGKVNTEQTSEIDIS